MTLPHSVRPVIEPPHPLPDATRLGLAELVVSDLDRSAGFYRTVVGLDVRDSANASVTLGGKGGPAVLRLVEEKGAMPASTDAAGLFHLALLLPERRDLAVAYARLERSGALTGASDHLVSEALYLDDPDGAGIEIYRDRPRVEWPVVDGRLAMATDPIDRDGLLALAKGEDPDGPAPAGVRLGHVHLKVADLEVAKNFWVGTLGFALVTTYPGALFMAAGGYHHHVAANVWRSRGRGPQGQGHAGLRSWEVILPEAADVDALGRRLLGSGHVDGGTVRVREPSGADLVFRAEDAEVEP